MPCYRSIPLDERRIDPASLPSARARGEPPFDAGKRELLIGICQAFSPGDESLRSEIEKSMDDPDQFCRQFRELLGTSCHDLPFAALIHGLIERNLLVSLDHRFGPEDVFWNIARLATHDIDQATMASWIRREGISTETSFPGQLLPALGAWFAGCGLVLGEVQLAYDSYDVVVLKPEAFDAAQALLQKSEYTTLTKVWAGGAR